jgi:guanylate kinase
MIRIYRLFAVFGASGSGKSTFLSIVRQICPDVSVHRKFTTRSRRPGEALENMEDLEMVDKINPDLCLAIYLKFEHYYGIRKDLIRIAYANREMHFIIIRDIQTIRNIKMMHPELVVIYVHSDPHTIEDAIQAREGIDKAERLRRIEDDYQDYVNNVELFDHTVLNLWDKHTAERQFRRIIAYYQQNSASSLR